MDCHDAKLLIEDYWDRRLSAETAGRVDAHLFECPTCRAEYGLLTDLLTRPSPVSVPAGLREHILQAIEPLPMPAAEAVEIRGRRRWFEAVHRPWVGALAACLTFAFLGWLSWQIPSGGTGRGYVSTISRPAPHPVWAAGWVQAMSVPGPGRALAALAQADTMERFVDTPAAAPVVLIRRQRVMPDLMPEDSTPQLRELPFILQAIRPLGA